MVRRKNWHDEKSIHIGEQRRYTYIPVTSVKRKRIGLVSRFHISERPLKSGVDGLSQFLRRLTTNIKGQDEKGSQLTAKPAKR